MTPGGEYLSADFIANYINDEYFLVALLDDKIIGAVYGEELKGNGVLLWLLAIDPNFSHQGIGTQLLYSFEQNCRKNKRD